MPKLGNLAPRLEGAATPVIREPAQGFTRAYYGSPRTCPCGRGYSFKPAFRNTALHSYLPREAKLPRSCLLPGDRDESELSLTPTLMHKAYRPMLYTVQVP